MTGRASASHVSVSLMQIVSMSCPSALELLRPGKVPDIDAKQVVACLFLGGVGRKRCGVDRDEGAHPEWMALEHTLAVAHRLLPFHLPRVQSLGKYRKDLCTDGFVGGPFERTAFLGAIHPL